MSKTLLSIKHSILSRKRNRIILNYLVSWIVAIQLLSLWLKAAINLRENGYMVHFDLGHPER